MQGDTLTISLSSRDVSIARVTKDAEAMYKDESDLAAETSIEFGLITLRSRTLVSYATLAQEILQGAAYLDELVQNALGESIALEMDKAALFGLGTQGPLSLYNIGAVNAVLPNANGFSFADYDEFSEAIQKIEDANGIAVSAIYSLRTARQLRELKETANNQYINAPEFFTKLNRYTTNQVPNDLVCGNSPACFCAFVGDFSQMIFGVRQELRLDVYETAGEAWQRYQYKIRCILRYDIGVLRPTHFSIIKGIK